ncbi:mediator complex, subunit Med10, partial [Rhypophila decipiens]
MAPVNTQLNNVQENVKNVIHDLFQVMTQVSHYDSAGRPSRESLAQDLQTLDSSLLAVYRAAEALPPPPLESDNPKTTPSSSSATNQSAGYTGIPLPLIQYVEDGRNPDIYTREFVELVRRMNQLAKGKVYAFRNFRDVLAHEMDSALPELGEDVRRVLQSTGG